MEEEAVQGEEGAGEEQEEVVADGRLVQVRLRVGVLDSGEEESKATSESMSYRLRERRSAFFSTMPRQSYVTSPA